MHPSGPRLMETDGFNSPSYSTPSCCALFGESEKRGAGAFVSWAAEVVMPLQYSGLRQCHTSPSIHLCKLVFQCFIFYLASHLIPLTSGLTLIL